MNKNKEQNKNNRTKIKECIKDFIENNPQD